MRKRFLSLIFAGFWRCVHVGNLFEKRVHKIAFWVHVLKTCSQNRILGTCLENVSMDLLVLDVFGECVRVQVTSENDSPVTGVCQKWKLLGPVIFGKGIVESDYYFDPNVFRVRVRQVHHKQMLIDRNGPSETKLSDQVVFCANCHLLIHVDPKNSIPIAKLRKMLDNEKENVS